MLLLAKALCNSLHWNKFKHQLIYLLPVRSSVRASALLLGCLVMFANTVFSMPNATDDWTSVDDRASQLVQTKLSLIQGSQFYTACQRDTQITGCYLLLNESDMSISAIQLNNIDSLLYACFNIIYFLIESTTSFSGCRLKQLSCILSQCWILL